MACAAWLFLVLPRLQGHMDPWEREYEAAARAYKAGNLAAAKEHIRAAHELACERDSADGRRETEKLMRQIQAS
jgi:hypothetical protein